MILQPTFIYFTTVVVIMKISCNDDVTMMIPDYKKVRWTKAAQIKVVANKSWYALPVCINPGSQHALVLQIYRQTQYSDMKINTLSCWIDSFEFAIQYNVSI